MTEHEEPIAQSEETSIQPPVPPDGAGIPWGFLLGTIMLAAVIVFAVQNSDPVPIRFIGWEGEFPLSIALAVAVFGAMILTQSIGAIARRRRRRRKAEREELRARREDG